MQAAGARRHGWPQRRRRRRTPPLAAPVLLLRLQLALMLGHAGQRHHAARLPRSLGLADVQQPHSPQPQAPMTWASLVPKRPELGRQAKRWRPICVATATCRLGAVLAVGAGLGAWRAPLCTVHVKYSMQALSCCMLRSVIAIELHFPRYYRNVACWQRSHGSLLHNAWGKKKRTVWLAERPARRGGEWGIGCLFCAHLLMRLSEHPCSRTTLCRA